MEYSGIGDGRSAPCPSRIAKSCKPCVKLPFCVASGLESLPDWIADGPKRRWRRLNMLKMHPCAKLQTENGGWKHLPDSETELHVLPSFRETPLTGLVDRNA